MPKSFPLISRDKESNRFDSLPTIFLLFFHFCYKKNGSRDCKISTIESISKENNDLTFLIDRWKAIYSFFKVLTSHFTTSIHDVKWGYKKTQQAIDG